jgi:two-component system LytT family sensor kinase
MEYQEINKIPMKTPILKGNKMRILLHIAAWVILLGLPLYNINRWNIPNEFVWLYYINAIINGIIFYGNYLFLIPRFFFNASRIKYYLLALVLATGLFFASDLSNKIVFEYAARNEVTDQVKRGEPIEIREGQSHSDRDRRFFRLPFRQMHLYNFGFTALVITIFALGLRVLERHAQSEKRQKELEKEKLNSELAFLKNQISPHFFFNTLNNIYSLISINTEDSQNAVLKLSRMMRYLLYESEMGETKLSSEIDFMNNYIDLMKLRISEKVKLNVSFPTSYENKTVPPLLFISIIENAFKHGISYREKSFIDIDMDVSKEMITFRCVNSIVKTGDEVKSENAGIGLENLKKRLKLLFPDRHEFIIDKSESTFNVLVRIFLTKT